MSRRILSDFFKCEILDDGKIEFKDKGGIIHKLRVYCGINRPFIVFNGKRYYLY